MKAEEQVGPKQICMKTALENSIQFVRDQDLKALKHQELKSIKKKKCLAEVWRNATRARDVKRMP